MALIALASPYNMSTATLTIVADDYTAAVTEVTFSPKTSASTIRTIDGVAHRDQMPSEWDCTIGLVQDLAPSGLLRYLLANDGLHKSVVFTPKSGGPSVAATLVISAATIGGKGGSQAESSATLAVDGKPAFTDVSSVPALTGATPSGAAASALVTITGSSLTGATTVKFGATNATAFTVLSDSTIVASMPAGSAGAANITVTTPTGTSGALSYTRGA